MNSTQAVPPEVITAGSMITAKGDMWCVGVVLFELLALEHPFRAANPLDLLSKIAHNQYSPVPDAVSPQLCKVSPVDRPTTRQRYPFACSCPSRQ